MVITCSSSHGGNYPIYSVQQCESTHLLYREKPMLVTKKKAAKLAGVSRRTFYNHIPQKKISITKDDDGAEKIDISELERIYGKETIARNRKELMEEGEGTVQGSEIAHPNSQGNVNYQNLLLEERVKHLQEQKIQLENHQKREREQYYEEIENLREALKRAQETTLLIEDKSKEKGEWEKSFRGLEQRIVNQEKATKEEIAKNEKIAHENKLLRKALKEEKNKSWWKKLVNN